MKRLVFSFLILAGTILSFGQKLNDFYNQPPLPKGYEFFIYDNGPDYISNGYQRIVKDDKIGYYNSKTKKIAIAPQFKCAEPFKNGKALVAYDCETSEEDSEGHYSWNSAHWLIINKKGKVIGKINHLR